MSHQPFETWLLSEEPLSPEQAQNLQTHLNTCEFCQRLAASWSEVQRLFHTAPPVQPAEGFAARWQDRLAAQRMEERLRHQRRQSWVVMIVSMGIAMLFFLLWAIQVVSTYNTPAEVLLVALYRLAELLSLANTVQELVLTLPAVVISAIPPYWLAVFAAAIGLLSLLWIFSLRKLMLPRRITQ